MTTTTNKINGRVKGEIETFTIGTYNGISVLVRDKDGYINAAKLGNNKKRARKYANGESFNEICDLWMKNRSAQKGADPKMTAKYQILNASNEFKGTYVHPDLVHFVAEWVDISYAFTVANIMNSINDKVHEVLNTQQLPDTPENAKPAFVEVVKQIAPSVDIGLTNKQCWGYRERFHELDQWEQDDLRRDVNEYNEMKKRIEELEEKVNKWGSYVKQYCPEFKNEDEEKKKRIDELEKKVNKLGSYVKQYCPEFVKIDEF